MAKVQKSRQTAKMGRQDIIILAVIALVIVVAVTLGVAARLGGQKEQPEAVPTAVPQAEQAGASADWADTWVLTGAEINGILMGPQALENMGTSMTLTLNADGTFEETEDDVTNRGTWSATENGVTLDKDGQNVALTCADGVLTMQQEGGTLMLTRQGAAAARQEETVELRRSVSAAEFAGSWRVTHVNMIGMRVPAENMGLYMALVLEDGVGIYGESTEDGEVSQLAVTYALREAEDGTAMDVSYTNVEGVTEVILTLYMTGENQLYMNVNDVDVFFTNQEGGE